MIQNVNIIHVDEGGILTPHVVYERVSEFSKPQLRNGLRLIREQRSDGIFLLVCERIKDAEWSDIETDK